MLPAGFAQAWEAPRLTWILLHCSLVKLPRFRINIQCSASVQRIFDLEEQFVAQLAAKPASHFNAWRPDVFHPAKLIVYDQHV